VLRAVGCGEGAAWVPLKYTVTISLWWPHLFQRLQALGTALAVEIDKYESHIAQAGPSALAQEQT
jgi:hypothetical protein